LTALGSLLGISLTSALKWTRRAFRDWNAYLASWADGESVKTSSARVRVCL
jgi:hypothetical protein